MEKLLDGFGPGRTPDDASYENLFLYLLEGFERRRSRSGSRAYYPGRPSSHGVRVDGLEGFSRSAPFWGAWVRSGRKRRLALSDGREVDLVETFRRGLLAGTDPASPGYWGDVGDRDQRTVEAADVALALWLFRETVWDDLRGVERDRVVAWLGQVFGKEVWDNNWHLFPLLVDAVLRAFGHPGDRSAADRHWARFVSFHRGEGWFSDGPGRVFDYYNAWGTHYALSWLRRVDPDRDPGFLDDVQGRFLEGYRHLIGPRGFPILGRSVCYRIAVAAPLVFGQETDPGTVSAGEARRALDATWSYFVAHGALRGGNVTQGYHGSDARLLDDYSGPASGLWSLRSLVAAFSFPADSPFWRAVPTPLPVERSSYELVIEPIGWRVTGVRESGAIRVAVLANAGRPEAPLERQSLRARVAELLLRSARRPENRAAKYGRPVYASDRPFCEGPG